MPRERLCKVCRGWHDLSQPWPHNCREAEQGPRQTLAAPLVNFDTMGKAVQSMTNGMFYDSKSALRREYKRAGVVEVGNEAPTQRKRPEKPTKKERMATIGKALSRAGFSA